MAKNALYRRFRLATCNEFQLKETEVVLPSKKKKKTGFTMDDQERIALAQADLKNKGRKGLGFGKPQDVICAPKASTPDKTVKKSKKKKKKKSKKRKRDESISSSPGSVAEEFLDNFLSELQKDHKHSEESGV